MSTDKNQELFARLETGLTQLLTNGDWQDYLRTQSRFHSYSFNNILLIFSQYPSASQIAGYRTWQQLGRQVKKGEKAIQILAPIKRRIESETEEATWNIFGFKKTSVFDISQTEGVAYIVLQHFGLDSSGYSFGYIAAWQENEDALDTLKASGSRIQKTANRIIEFLSQQEESESDCAKDVLSAIAA